MQNISNFFRFIVKISLVLVAASSSLNAEESSIYHGAYCVIESSYDQTPGYNHGIEYLGRSNHATFICPAIRHYPKGKISQIYVWVYDNDKKDSVSCRFVGLNLDNGYKKYGDFVSSGDDYVGYKKLVLLDHEVEYYLSYYIQCDMPPMFETTKSKVLGYQINEIPRKKNSIGLD